MLSARTPCICIDTSEIFNRLTTAGHILWLFTIFCAFTATGLLIFGVFAALAQSWFIRAAADFIRGSKRKRGAMTRIDCFYIAVVIAVFIRVILQVIAAMLGHRVTDPEAVFLFVMVLLYGLITLLYIGVRLLPIAYPALYRKDGDE